MAIPPALILAGPTAVGKSSLALDIVEAVGGEIVSADSRQIYQGMDVGTAKPIPSERTRVPHHLIDLLAPSEAYSAGQFLRDTRQVLADLARRDVPAVVVGGSTLYVHALVVGMADLPPVPEELTTQLSEEARTASGREALYAELQAGDPEAAATLDSTKSQRLVRFVGVLRTSESLPSQLWAEAHEPGVPNRLVVLTRERRELYERIDRRVEEMVRAGLQAEARALYNADDAVRRTMASTIGYREWLPVFEGVCSPETAVALIQRNSRRYAKRQMTWYRRYPEAVAIEASSATVEDVLREAEWPEST